MSQSSESQPTRYGWLLQIGLSALLLFLFISSMDGQQLRDLPARMDWTALLVAAGIKLAALIVHEVRFWVLLPHPRAHPWLVARIGFVSGMLNIVLPGRTGDIVNIALVHRRCGVGLGTATATMALVAILEAAVFGMLLLMGLVWGASQWQTILGQSNHLRTMQAVGLATGAGLVALTGCVVLGRRLMRDPAPTTNKTSMFSVLREAFTRTGAALSKPSAIALHVSLALLQVVGLVAAFAMALPAVGITVPSPFFVAAGVLGLSAVAAVALPPSYGAGPTAAGFAVLSTLGCDQADVVAYAAAWWLLSQVPTLGIGLPSMWSLGLSFRTAKSLKQPN